MSEMPAENPGGVGAGNLPPDRGHLATERRNARTMKLHAMSVRDCVEVINLEDAAVIGAVHRAEDQIVAFVEAVETCFCARQQPGRLIYLGAGTSGRLGVLDASEAPPTFQVPPDRIIGIIAGGDGSLRKSSEGREDEFDGAVAELDALKLTDRDAVLGIAAGGTTPYVLGALVHAKKVAPKCVTGMLACTPIAKPAACDHLIVLNTGPEVLTGSTRMKAGTATKIAINTISTTLMVRSGRVYQNLMVDLRASNAKLRDRAARVVSTITGLDRAAAFALLDRAGGLAKVAVVMHVKDVEAAAAGEMLEKVGGRLDRVIEG
ncbi:MAG: N-acetylmuramic acid 6-phosphate etherase [Phycisphaerales bacterium]